MKVAPGGATWTFAGFFRLLRHGGLFWEEGRRISIAPTSRFTVVFEWWSLFASYLSQCLLIDAILNSSLLSYLFLFILTYALLKLVREEALTGISSIRCAYLSVCLGHSLRRMLVIRLSWRARVVRLYSFLPLILIDIFLNNSYLFLCILWAWPLFKGRAGSRARITFVSKHLACIFLVKLKGHWGLTEVLFHHGFPRRRAARLLAVLRDFSHCDRLHWNRLGLWRALMTLFNRSHILSGRRALRLAWLHCLGKDILHLLLVHFQIVLVHCVRNLLKWTLSIEARIF